MTKGQRGAKSLGQRLAPPRFLIFLGIFGGGCGLLRELGLARDMADALTMAFDAATLVFLVSLVPLLRAGSSVQMRRNAQLNDANRLGVLVIATVLTVVVLTAIAGELPHASAGNPWAMVRLIGTLLLAWLFANVVYALHYAHLFYADDDDGAKHGGLEFPATKEPDYLDFAYFAFTMGMTFQTSDVVICSRTIRRIATLHGFAAFIFNIGIIAFTINALGGAH